MMSMMCALHSSFLEMEDAGMVVVVRHVTKTLPPQNTPGEAPKMPPYVTSAWPTMDNSTPSGISENRTLDAS